LLGDPNSTPGTRIWDGGSTLDSNWMTPENWVGDETPGARFPLGPFLPYDGNPVLRPQGSAWESK